ncbi:MAG TPA: hypothetical protein ENG92_01375 [Thiolapillus brandeum]|uniref:Uncharacterized protein n=1 Tax=Thiolapillus brandeum TaxID=1076588 RepID=A0A831K4F6_9GAMM|nr:hypothetical protein [Thiolapillus brandeum]
MEARKVPLPARFKVKISELEAEIAFCDALITFAGQIPETVYQRAEIQVYKSLEGEFKQRLKIAQKEALERSRKLTV